MEWRRRGTMTWRRWAIYGVITICLCVLMVFLPTLTGLSPFLVFGIAWAILLALLILLPKRAEHSDGAGNACGGASFVA
jgi:uncharacterized membrane protein HdeD (DUF308 family)